MKVNVDLEICDGHGQCEFAAPEVFQLDEQGDLHYTADVDDALRPKVEEAERLCPVQAITIES